MDIILINAAFYLAGVLALTGFACYICRGRPAALSLSRRKARERRALRDIERQLIAEAMKGSRE